MLHRSGIVSFAYINLPLEIYLEIPPIRGFNPQQRHRDQTSRFYPDPPLGSGNYQ